MKTCLVTGADETFDKKTVLVTGADETFDRKTVLVMGADETFDKKTVLVTGADGFLGKNLCAHLMAREDRIVHRCDLDTPESELRHFVSQADVIFHLAGVNRPANAEDFENVNAGFTQMLVNLPELADCQRKNTDRRPHIVFSSSIQAEQDSPYGQSKRHAEEILEQWAKTTGEKLSIFRLTNLFGKWSRPDYNSVTATFCYRIAHDLPIEIHDPNAAVTLAYVDDVVAAFLDEVRTMPAEGRASGVFVPASAIPATTVTLGDLAAGIRFFHEMPQTLMIPDFSDRFQRQLYATYLSFRPCERWSSSPPTQTDARGSLTELVKSQTFGQMFVSRTHPGVTRGNHYHHTKTEKFIVLSGEAVIRFRSIFGDEVIEFPVRGEDCRIVDIPPGYAHNITNTGDTELITLFWASAIFDKNCPDTCAFPVELP